MEAIKITELLYELGRIFTTSPGIEKLLDDVLTASARYIPIERGMISIYRRDTDDIVLDVSYGYRDEEIRRGMYKPGEGITGTVIATGKPAIVPSIKDEPRFLDDQLKITRGNITRAAENLGTTKRILNYRIKQLGIDFSKFREGE